MELTADLIIPDKTALIIVDVQNDYCHEEGALASGGNDVSAVREMMPQAPRADYGGQNAGSADHLHPDLP